MTAPLPKQKTMRSHNDFKSSLNVVSRNSIVKSPKALSHSVINTPLKHVITKLDHQGSKNYAIIKRYAGVSRIVMSSHNIIIKSLKTLSRVIINISSRDGIYWGILTNDINRILIDKTTKNKAKTNKWMHKGKNKWYYKLINLLNDIYTRQIN